MNPLYLIGIPLALLALLSTRTANAPKREPTVTFPFKHHFTKLAPAVVAPTAEPELVAGLSRKWSAVFKTPVSWLRSQAYAESKNITAAVNNVSGAMGVLQILPDTAKWLAKSLRKSAFAANPIVQATLTKTQDLADLLNPDVNVMLAAYYLVLLTKRFGQNHDVVAAAYNMGPNKIAYYVNNQLPLPARSRVYLAMVKEGKRRGYT